MRKFRLFTNFEKEERWLSDMASRGYELIEKSLRYKFRKAEPKKSIIKIDYRTFKNQVDYQDYRTLFEDSGWKHIAGTKNSGHQYFKKVGENASEDIFSDVASKAGRYQRLSRVYLTFTILYFPILVALVLTDTVDISTLINPKLLYYTPGLWERTGIAFWRAFLFETPFALFRGFLFWFILVVYTLYLIYALKAKWQYQKVKK